MRPLSTTLILAAAAAAAAAAIVAPGLAALGTTPVIDATCSAMKYYSNPGYEYCVRLLMSDPAGAAATDARTLAVVAASATARNVTATLRLLFDLVDDLNTCVGYYRRMGDTVASALAELRAGAGRTEKNVTGLLYEASLVPENCNVLLSGARRQSARKDPMGKENMENLVLARLATNIALLLK